MFPKAALERSPVLSRVQTSGYFISPNPKSHALLTLRLKPMRTRHSRASKLVVGAPQTFKMRQRLYRDAENPPILHRKEEFVPTDDPLRPKTRQGEKKDCMSIPRRSAPGSLGAGTRRQRTPHRRAPAVTHGEERTKSTLRERSRVTFTGPRFCFQVLQRPSRGLKRNKLQIFMPRLVGPHVPIDSR